MTALALLAPHTHTHTIQVDKEVERLVEASRPYCLCQALYDERRPMIGCDYCNEWYHWECVGLSPPGDDQDDEEVAPPDFKCPCCCMLVGIEYPQGAAMSPANAAAAQQRVAGLLQKQEAALRARGGAVKRPYPHQQTQTQTLMGAGRPLKFQRRPNGPPLMLHNMVGMNMMGAQHAHHTAMHVPGSEYPVAGQRVPPPVRQVVVQHMPSRTGGGGGGGGGGGSGTGAVAPTTARTAQRVAAARASYTQAQQAQQAQVQQAAAHHAQVVQRHHAAQQQQQQQRGLPGYAYSAQQYAQQAYHAAMQEAAALGAALPGLGLGPEALASMLLPGGGLLPGSYMAAAAAGGGLGIPSVSQALLLQEQVSGLPLAAAAAAAAAGLGAAGHMKGGRPGGGQQGVMPGPARSTAVRSTGPVGAARTAAASAAAAAPPTTAAAGAEAGGAAPAAADAHPAAAGGPGGSRGAGLDLSAPAAAPAASSSQQAPAPPTAE